MQNKSHEHEIEQEQKENKSWGNASNGNASASAFLKLRVGRKVFDATEVEDNVDAGKKRMICQREERGE